MMRVLLFLIGKFPPSQPSPLEPLDDGTRLSGSGKGSLVVSALEFVHVALQVPVAHLVVSAVIAALEKRPNRFHSVGLGAAVHELAYGMCHC